MIDSQSCVLFVFFGSSSRFSTILKLSSQSCIWSPTPMLLVVMTVSSTTCPFLIFLVKVETMANLWVVLCNPEHQLIARLFYQCYIVLRIYVDWFAHLSVPLFSLTLRTQFPSLQLCFPLELAPALLFPTQPAPALYNLKLNLYRIDFWLATGLLHSNVSYPTRAQGHQQIWINNPVRYNRLTSLRIDKL
jgi:hypothetical protein